MSPSAYAFLPLTSQQLLVPLSAFRRRSAVVPLCSLSASASPVDPPLGSPAPSSPASRRQHHVTRPPHVADALCPSPDELAADAYAAAAEANRKMRARSNENLSDHSRYASNDLADNLANIHDSLEKTSTHTAPIATNPSVQQNRGQLQEQLPSLSEHSVDVQTGKNGKIMTMDSSIQSGTQSSPALLSDDLQAAWAKKGYANAISRTFEIWMFFFTSVTTESNIRKLKDPAEMSRRRKIHAVRMKDSLLSLGPTFIKLGQLMSTRVDIVPKEYIEELSCLQDRVPGFSGARAIEVIEAEFGRPIAEVYDSFDPVPIAAASLGQVHRAVLDGKQVAVKIQRAGLKELFDVDLKNLKFLARLLDKMDPKTDGTKRNWVSIYEESAKLLYEEIDYALEAQNAERFRANFAGTPWIKVPDIYWDLTTTRILTMEYVPGIKINDYEAIERAGIDRKLLARRSAESYLTQLLRHGYFHTDPHCGNISCDAVEGGRLIIYDYGMMSSFPANIKEGLVDVIFGIYEGSATEICDAMVSMGVLSNGADRVTVEKIGRYFLGLFRTNLSSENRKKSREEKRAEMIKRLDSIGEDLLAVSEDECFNFPPVFTFVFRSFTTLEGIGKGLDPNYDLTLIAGPYLKDLMDLRDGSAGITAFKTFQKKVGWRAEDINAVVTAPRKTAYIENTLRRMESGDLRIRVRVLESERAFKRMSIMQENMSYALGAATFSNIACALMVHAERYAVQARLAWLIACLFTVRLAVGLLKYRSLELRMQKFTKGGL